MTGHAHTLAEWAAMVCLATSGYGVLSVPYFLLVDADRKDFDPRPLLARAYQVAVFAAGDLNRATAAVRHELAPQATAVRHALYGGREIARDAAALLLLLTTTPRGAMTATGHLDTDGNEFEDEALYTDSYGDTWKYHGGIDEFLLVKLVHQKAPITGTNVIDHFEPAQPLARDFGPMARIPGGRPCAECPETAPRGRAFCSTRCRNAADRHDDLDGEL